MRSYPIDSPEAAARIVALVLIADGHVSRSETETLQQLKIEDELGLPQGMFWNVVHTLCDDLLATAYGAGVAVCSVDEATLSSLLAEVQNPVLRARVLQLVVAAVGADRHLADAESLVLETARRQWRCESAADADRAAKPTLETA